MTVTEAISPDPKRIAIIGATGLVGSALFPMLDLSRFEVVVVGRSRDKLAKAFPDALDHMSWAEFEQSDAHAFNCIVNLAGSSVSGQKWTKAYKHTMIDSRINSTTMCVEKCRENPDIHLINASAVSAYGFYTETGPRFTEADRDLRRGSAFLQDLIDAWEAAALRAEDFGSRVTLLRTGVVFDRQEGALAEMMKPFQMFIGGPIGTGHQMMSWISTRDIARIIAFLLEHPEITGPVNCTSPGAVSNAEFAKALGHAMGKPSFVRTPAFVIRAAMGQMGDELIVKGQHVYPEKLLSAGFRFDHPSLNAFFAEVLER